MADENKRTAVYSNVPRVSGELLLFSNFVPKLSLPAAIAAIAKSPDSSTAAILANFEQCRAHILPSQASWSSKLHISFSSFFNLKRKIRRMSIATSFQHEQHASHPHRNEEATLDKAEGSRCRSEKGGRNLCIAMGPAPLLEDQVKSSVVQE